MGIVALSGFGVGHAAAQGTGSSPSRVVSPRFGGTEAPEVYLDIIQRRREDASPKYLLDGLDEAMEPWFQAKARLEDRHGLRIGGHYQINFQEPDHALQQPDFGLGGLARLTGTWTPSGRSDPDAGRLAFTVDHRHKIGNGVAPSALAQQIGYIGSTNAILGDTDFDSVDLYWVQPCREGTAGFVVGRMDPNNFFSTHGFSSPWTGFTNNEVVNAVGVLQPQSSWGLLGGYYLTDKIYGLAGTFDANGTASDNLEFFRDGAEFWSGIEVGFVPSPEERLERKISLTLWHVTPRERLATEESYGINASVSWTVGDWFPFARLAVSEGNAPVYNKSALIGFRKKVRDGADVIGAAWGVGDSAAGLGWQNAFEVFYNYFLAKNLAITADLQRIGNPLLNPADDDVWLFGVRTRFTF